MQPLYFLPGANALSESLLAEHGLADLIGSTRTEQQTFRGPGGAAGIIVSGGELTTDQLLPDETRGRWSRRSGYTSLVGTWNDAPPTELELQRTPMVDGEAVTLLDGHAWRIPRLRKWRTDKIMSWEPALPRLLTQDFDSGQWALGDVVPQYARIWETSFAIVSDMVGSGDLDWETRLNYAADLLAINYRIDKSLLAHLRLLTIDNAAEIIRCALDWPSLEDQIKKEFGRLHGGINTESGATPPTVG